MPFMDKKQIKLSDQIRRAVDASGISRYRICKDLGIAESTMSRFMAGLGGLSMEYLDALADLLELNLADFRPKVLAQPAPRATKGRKPDERPSLEKEKHHVPKA
jgi:transcriptional regulator with XRE-family HTH domain